METTDASSPRPDRVPQPLPEIGALCVELSDWYTRFHTEDSDASLRSLETLLKRVRKLQPVAGPLGTALTLLETGGLNDTVNSFTAIDDAAARYRDAVAQHLVGTHRPTCPPFTRDNPVQELPFTTDASAIDGSPS